MIELNLLPTELRKKKGWEWPDIKPLPVSIGILGVLIVAHLIVSVMLMKSGSLSGTLKKQWEQMGPQREKTDKIIAEIAELNKRVNAAKKIAKPELAWTRLLGGLNQAVIPGVWLVEFKLVLRSESDMPKSLSLTGYALGKSNVATAIAARFINSLKSNEDFFGYFEGVELKNITKRDIAGQECMMFKLDCRFKKSGTIGKKTKKPQKK